MRRFISILILLFSMSFLLVAPAFSWWWDKTLVTIDGTSYTTDDFKAWWKNWNDENLELPKTADPYVDWLLLAREGERMDLASDPAFQRRTNVFLQVRSLLLLQKEEINDRIKISDADLKPKYRELFTPIWLLQRLQFKDEETAKTACQKLADGTLTIDELLKLTPEEGGPISTREDWRRPSGIDPEWADKFKQLSVGGTTSPVPFDEYFVVYRLKEKEDASDEDFAKLRDRLRDMVWKEKEAVVSKDLLARLRSKFEVKVDQERLSALPLSAADDAYSDSDHHHESPECLEKDFIAILRRDNAFRMEHDMTKEKEDEHKNRIVDGILAQNMTNWESLDRHYEEREPFKQEYQFNINHRLTREVEERLLVSETKVTEAEIESYYQANLSRYSQPEIVKFSIIEDNDGVVDRIWGDILTGKSFAKAVLEHTDKKDNPQDFPYGHLDPAVQKVVDGLAKGETSQPFVSKDSRFILHLVDRTPAQPIPLARVADSIRAKLEQDKLVQKRKEYLDQLKSRSQIKVNQSAWKTVQKELGEAK
jgi:hypothetical protein